MVKHYRHGRPTLGILIGWYVYGTPPPYSYLNAIFRGISAAAKDKDCNVLLAYGMGTSVNPSEPLHQAWPTLDKDSDFAPVGPWNTDGLIVVNPLNAQSRSDYIHSLIEAGHPVVFIANGEGEPAVTVDNADGVSQAMSHLIGHGHQRIAFIAGNQGDSEGDSGDRLRAYQAAVQQFGLATSPDLLVYGYHSFTGGYAAMQRLLASQESFTAVLASNDESAMGAMRALKEAGLKIPEDVAIIGFDDRPEAAAQAPPLTSIHIPLYKSGYEAVGLLLHSIERGPGSIHSLKVPTSLAIRQSCGCRQDAADVAGSIQSAASVPLTGELHRAHIIQDMAQAALTETQHFSADEIQQWCQRLVNTFIASIEKSSPLDFQETVEALLVRVEAASDDAHIWQAVISSLRRAVPDLIETTDNPTAQLSALDFLDRARNAISERMRRQHGQYIIDQKWMANQIASLTARLLITSHQTQIYEVLDYELPAMGIQRTSLAFFESDGDDSVAWSILRTIPDAQTPPIRFPTRQFPPERLYPLERQFSLVLLPLVSSAGLTGFIAYDSINIELDGPITQQIAAALNNARLYAEATEGRKLAEEANNLKSRFLSMVSHELRTPLNLIVGLSEMLLQKRKQGEPSLPNPYRKDVGQIVTSAHHLGRLIRDVLDLASSEVGQLRLMNELLDLSETLEMVAATGHQLADDKGLTWREGLPETKLWVWGDRTRLRQVALNLVSNAVKFTSHGEVSLQVERKHGRAVVVVRDSGMGISPDEQVVIFDEFRRSERATAQGYGGLGLGLAISKRLVEMHGGEIGVRSSGEEGAGSTFYFTLPIIEPEIIHREDQRLPISLEQMVLLLTNPSGSGDRLREHLLQKGFEVSMMQIDEGLDWLATLLKSPPGAIVLDIAIAPAQGWDVLKILKETPTTRDIPLLFYSLTNDKGAMMELDTLTKPVGVTELARVLEYQQLNTEGGSAEKVFLVVDDDPATLELHVRILQSQAGRHQILRARNGREALDLMQHQRPDLVLLDLMMPELDGFGVLEAMREKDSTRDIPVIVLTGQILTEKEMARLNRGVVTVLGKGLFSVEETLSHIEAALTRQRKLGSEAQRLVRQAMAYLHQHYADPISREDLAHHLGMNGDYLTLCFRREVGMTPIAYLNRYRVNQAKILLAESDKSITGIALAVGFPDSKYFSRVFREQVGKSPNMYRRR